MSYTLKLVLDSALAAEIGAILLRGIEPSTLRG